LIEQTNPSLQRLSIFQDRFFWLAFFFGGFFLSLTLWFSLGMDQSTFCYGAWVWKTYHLPPYVGAFDQNFPGIFIIHRLVLTLFGDSILGFRIFDFLIQLCSLTMLFYLARRLSGKSTAGFLASVFYGIYYYGLGNFDTAQREGFVLCLLLLATIFSLRLEKMVWLRMSLAGLSLGFAFLIKPFYGLAWLVFGIWFFIEAFRKNKASAFLQSCLFAICCLIPSALVLLYYWKLGYLRELYQAVILYNFGSYALSGASGSNIWVDKLLIVLSSLSWPNSLLAFSASITIMLGLKKDSSLQDKRLLVLLIFLIAVSLSSYWLQGKFFPYHLLPLMGLMMILSGAGFSWLGDRFSAGLRSGRSLLFLYYISLLFFAFLVLSPDLVMFSWRHSFRSMDQAYLGWLNSDLDTHYSSNNYLVAKKLEPLLKPEDRIEYFGPYPLIPFLLKKKLPSRFSCVQHLLFLPRTREMLILQKQWSNDYTQAVIQSQPKFFLVSDQFPGSHHKFFSLASKSLKTALRSRFPELQKFLDLNYEMIMKVGVIEVYQLKTGSAGEKKE